APVAAPAPRPAAAPTAAPPNPGPAAGEDSGSARRALAIAGWSVLGAGGALLIAGAVTGGMAAAKASEIEQKRGEYTEFADIDRAGRRLQTAQIVTLALGGAAVLAGSGLLWWSYHLARREQRSVQLSPMVVSHGALLGLQGRF